MSDDEMLVRFADAARELEGETDTQHTMERTLVLARELVTSCDYAGISLVRRRDRIESPAYTDPVVLAVDSLQYTHQQGPCVDAIFTEEVVHSPDLAQDERWPTWGPMTVAETGIRSMLCFRLFVQSDTVGALNLYSRDVGSFDADDRDHGVALAAHAALAVVASRAIETLNLALDTRTVIAQATGILMERFGLDADRAFAVLRRVSQDSNRKLRDVAQELVITRLTPIYAAPER